MSKNNQRIPLIQDEMWAAVAEDSTAITRDEFEEMRKQVREMHLFIVGVKAALLANPMIRAMVPDEVLRELSGE